MKVLLFYFKFLPYFRTLMHFLSLFKLQIKLAFSKKKEKKKEKQTKVAAILWTT